MTNKERFVEFAKKHNVVKTEEALDRRLAIIPEMSRNVIETRWGLNGGSYCHRFEALDKVLGINGSKKAYHKAMYDLENAVFAEIIADREKIADWNVICRLGQLATVCVANNYHCIDWPKSDTSKITMKDVAEAIGPNMVRGIKLQEILDQLTPRERKVIIFRWGLDGNEIQTLQEMANTLGMTGERIKQIEAKVLRKLSRPGFIKLFYIPYIEKEEKKKQMEMMEPEEATEIFEMNVEDVGFSEGTCKCLKRANINTVGELLSMPEKIVEANDKFIHFRCFKEIIKFLESKRMANTDYKAAKEVLEEFMRNRREKFSTTNSN